MTKCVRQCISKACYDELYSWDEVRKIQIRGIHFKNKCHTFLSFLLVFNFFLILSFFLSFFLQLFPHIFLFFLFFLFQSFFLLQIHLLLPFVFPIFVYFLICFYSYLQSHFPTIFLVLILYSPSFNSLRKVRLMCEPLHLRDASQKRKKKETVDLNRDVNNDESLLTNLTEKSVPQIQEDTWQFCWSQQDEYSSGICQ